MPELQLKALKEWRRFVGLLALIMAAISILGFWKIPGYSQHGSQEYAACMAWMKASCTLLLAVIYETLRRLTAYLEEEQQWRERP